MTCSYSIGGLAPGALVFVVSLNQDIEGLCPSLRDLVRKTFEVATAIGEVSLAILIVFVR